MTFSINDANLQVIINRVENNEIYFDVYKNGKLIEVTDGGLCSLRYNSTKMKDVYYYIDKITYLGNNEFKLDQKVETKTYDDYMLEWRPFIDCGFIGITGGPDYSYAFDENDMSMLGDNSTIHYIYHGNDYKKVADNTKVCSVGKDGIYLFVVPNWHDPNDYKDYSHMYLKYINKETGEISPLVKGTAEGKFGDLATCR